MNQNSKNKHNGQTEMYCSNAIHCEWLTAFHAKNESNKRFPFIFFSNLFLMAIIINVEC